MKILITGGNGFIGKAIYKLLRLKHSVALLDKHTNNKYTTVNCDILTDECVIEEEIKKCDLVIHLASPVGVSNIDENSTTFLNEMLWINLLIFNLVKKYNKKIIFSSTSEVYLNNKNAKETDILSIGTPTKLRWGYASGKLTSEFLCRSLCKQSIILRPFNITGLGDNKGVLYNFLKSIKENKDINIYGNGKQKRAFCDIRDLVNFVDCIVDRDIYDNEIYNVGNSSNIITIKNFAKKIVKKYGSDININYRKYNEVFSPNYDDIRIRVPNCKKMNTVYKAKYKIDEIIESVL